MDIEGFDREILRELFSHDIKPPYISAESHDIGIFALMSALGNYNSFKLVRGAEVSQTYRDHPVRDRSGRLVNYSFPHHSAGPFGDDVIGRWQCANDFFRVLAIENLGWIDIHATNQGATPPRRFTNRVFLEMLLSKLFRRMRKSFMKKKSRSS